MMMTKLEHTMTRQLLYHFVGFAHNATTNADGRSGSAAGAQCMVAVALSYASQMRIKAFCGVSVYTFHAASARVNAREKA